MKAFERRTTAGTQIERTFVDKVTRRQIRLAALVLCLIALLLAGFRWTPPIPVPGPRPGPEPQPANDETATQEEAVEDSEPEKSQETPAIQYRSRAVVGVPTPPRPEPGHKSDEDAAEVVAPQPPHLKQVKETAEVAEQAAEESSQQNPAESNPESSINSIAATADVESAQENQPVSPIIDAEPAPVLKTRHSDHNNFWPEAGTLAEKNETPDDAPVGVVNRQEGAIAPQYTLDSLDAYKRMAEEHQGLFVAYDGVIFVRIGRSLEPRYARCEMIGKDQLRNYAPRMAPLPLDDPQVRQLHNAIRQRRTDLKPGFQIMLALPWSYDAEILRAQLSYCSERRIQPTGRLVTTGRFVEMSQDGRIPQFRIMSVAGGASTSPTADESK